MMFSTKFWQRIPINRSYFFLKNSDTFNNKQFFNTRHNPYSNDKIQNWIKQIENKNIRVLSTTMVLSSGLQNSEEKYTEFDSIFPEIIKELITTKHREEIVDVYLKQLLKCLHYNVSQSEKFSGQLVLSTYKLMENNQKNISENVRLACVLGWCVELLQGPSLIINDIMNNARTRRDVKCWHRLPEIGIKAVHDAMMLEHVIYILLKKYFKCYSFYPILIELFREVASKTAFGQSLDLMSLQSSGELNLHLFTRNRYDAIVKYKTSYNTVYLPVVLAMTLAGKTKEQINKAKSILLEIGSFYQFQDDFLEASNDISQGKCSWLIVTALELANSEQKLIIEQHYGRSNPDSVQIIKHLYENLHLAELYEEHKKDTHNKIKRRIMEDLNDLSEEVFLNIMDSHV